MKEVKIKVDEKGKISVETVGYKDESCLDVMKDMEKIFGKASDVKLKPEARIKAKKHRVKS